MIITDRLDWISDKVGYLLGMGQIISTVTGVLRTYMKSTIEFDDGDPNAINFGVRETVELMIDKSLPTRSSKDNIYN